MRVFAPLIGASTVGALFDFLYPVPEMALPDFEEKPLVASKDLQNLIQADSLKARATKFYENAKLSNETFGHPTRVIGSRGHEATLEYIEETLKGLDGYYKVKRQPFTAVSGNVKEFSCVDGNGEAVKVVPMSLTPPTESKISATVVLVENQGCLGSDYALAEGAIALVRRGDCSFGEKSELAGLKGALAMLVYDPAQPDDGEIPGGTLGVPMEHQVASLFVDRKWAEHNDGTLLELSVDSSVDLVQTVNVIAETIGGDHNNVVMLGAHSDSVAEGPGINDDGSGAISLLEVASQLAKFDVTNAVRFAWWAAEEEGLLGSLHYTENITPSEASKIRLFMDYDMMASPNYVYDIYDSNDEQNPQGSSYLRELYQDYYADQGLNWTTQPFDGRSDYVGFLEIGIPAGGVDTGAEVIKSQKDQEMFGGVEGKAYDWCYHMLCDDLDNVNYDAWLVNTKLIAHSVAKFANSLEDFPARVDFYRREGRKYMRPAGGKAKMPF